MPVEFSLSYTQEKLGIAVDILASSASPLPARMESAAISSLVQLMHDREPVGAGDEVISLWARVQEVIRDLSAFDGVAGEGSFAATISRLEDEDLQTIARKLVWALVDATRLEEAARHR